MHKVAGALIYFFSPIPQLVKLTLHQMVGFQTAFESSKISALKVTRSLLLISPKPLHGLDSLSRFPQFLLSSFFKGLETLG